MPIRLLFTQTDRDLTGQSKMWGCPDLPDTLSYPESEIAEDDETYRNPLTFICQIRCEDLIPFDTEGLLPHSGMLYFFAEVDYYLGTDGYDSPGMGEWPASAIRVLYTPTGEGLHTHSLVDEQGNTLGLPPEAITFTACNPASDGFKLLGLPFFDEVREQYPAHVSLFQMDEEDKWNLRFFDSGMLSFLLSAEDLKQRRFERTVAYLHSF